MRLAPNLAQEFEEICAEYEAVDQQGRDMVALIKAFGDEYDHLRSESNPDFQGAWEEFLEEHKSQVTSAMVGMILYMLIMYWDLGSMLGDQISIMERILVRDTVQDISEEIERRSKNGNE